MLVVGDLILDKYTIGRPTRISREAPVAVLEFVREYAVPGGGTNPACTVASLGGEAYLAGVVGDDEFACAGVRPQARAEELDVAAWGRLAACTPRPEARKTPTGPAPS